MRIPRALARRLLSFIFLAVAVCAGAQETEESIRQRVLSFARKYHGVPYMYGAESPSAFDCSGFVRYVYREAVGLILPRSARGIYSAGVPIDASKAKPGDVFVYDTVGGSPSHVAIYLGGGSVIHAVSEGPRTGVIVSSAGDSYFPPRLIAARSFLGGVGSEPKESGASEASSSPPPAGSASPKASATAIPNEASPAASDGPPIEAIGFSIPAHRESYTDRIPAATGTKIAFTVTNDTGRDGTFVVIFYKADPRFSDSKELRRELVRIPSGGHFDLPAYLFTEPGIYKLIVKDNWNDQLFQRIFTVEERRP